MCIYCIHFFFVPHTEHRSNDIPSKTLYVGNLPFNMTDSELMSLFPGCFEARVVSDPITGQSKGYVFTGVVIIVNQ